MILSNIGSLTFLLLGRNIALKKRIPRLLAVIAAISALLTVSAFASGTSAGSTKNADALFNLGLFKGTGSGYELDQTPTRIQGLVMLIRLLGEEDEALSCAATHSFSDVPQWADRYVAYAISKGYTKGTSASTFSPEETLNAKTYVTFALRALGYNDGNGDFSWDTALADSASFGLMTSASASTLSNITLNRGDMVDLSFCALTMPLKGETTTLAQKLVQAGVFTAAQGTANGVLGSRVTYTYTAYDNSTVDYLRKTVALASGKIIADVVTVNLNNPKVSVRSALVNNKIGATASFSNIVSQSGAKAVINSNFFQAYESFKIPIGHLACNGQFMYGVSGLSSFGFTSENKVVVGRPSLFYRVFVEGSATKNWPCYELNSIQQTNFNSVVYTPAYGATLKITCNGTAVFIENGVVAKISPCYVGGVLSIPTNGYIMWLGSEFTSTDYYHAPQVGDVVSMTPFLFKADAEGFTLDKVVSVVSGAPRLVKDGAIETYLDPGFTEARFTTAVTARTAIGTLPNGKLVLVSVSSATIQQMRELMLSLGCVDALNLDGGASTAMYCNGSYIRSPGRELTTTLQVFVSQ